MQNDQIKQLIKSAQGGNKNAYRELCNSNIRKIYNLAVRLILNIEIAEVLTENIFIEAWENIKSIREDQELVAWLNSIAIYKILDEIRTNEIKKELLKKKIITESDFSILSTDKFENLILILPDRKRIVFILHEIEKYTYDEIADFSDEMTKDEIKNIIQATRNSLINSPDYE